MLPNRARQLKEATAAVAVATSAAERTPPFARDAHTLATQLHLYPNINVARRNVAKSTRTSPSSSSYSSSSSSSASSIATCGVFENPHTWGTVPPGPAFKRPRAASYPMYSKPPLGTERVGAEPAPSHAPPQTPTRHRMTEPERSFKLVNGSDERIPLEGTHAMDADTHSDTRAVEYRPHDIPPPASAFNERNVGGVVVTVDDRRRGGQPAGIPAPDTGTHRDTGTADYRPHGFARPAHLINERDVTGFSKLGSKFCGKQHVHPHERASWRFATGTAVRAGRGVKADQEPPLSAAEISGKGANERAGGDLRSPPPLLGSTMARTGAARLRYSRSTTCVCVELHMLR